MNCYFREVYPVYVHCYSEISPVNGLIIELNGGGLNWYITNTLLAHLQRLLCFLKTEDHTKIKKWEF